MGTAASSARRHEHGGAAPEESDEDPFVASGLASSLDQVWADGVPFTLLHDEAFVAEKYDEIQRLHGRRPVPSDDDGDEEALQMTGTDELPLEEVEQLTDLARIKLFTRHRARVDAATAAKAGRGPSTTKDPLKNGFLL
ncbi:hypothetical protein PINS_up013455 [Pythium insidiosum]|nr:hypothetical protein PINS_up013455 [Pythium insidiosum]